MAYTVLKGQTFDRALSKLPRDIQSRIAKGLRVLEDDPFKPRSGADIKMLEGGRFPKLRLRIGDYRIVYTVAEEHIVKLLDVWHRGRDRYD